MAGHELQGGFTSTIEYLLHRLVYGFLALMVVAAPLGVLLGLVREFATPAVSTVLSVLIVMLIAIWVPVAAWVTNNALLKRGVLGEDFIDAFVGAFEEGAVHVSVLGRLIRERIARRGRAVSPDDPVEPR